MSICGEPHPDRPGLLCEMGEAQHEWHTSVDRSGFPPQGVDWRNEDFAPAQKTRTKAQREREAIDLRNRVREFNGVPVESKQAWEEQKADWLESAKQAVRVFCQQHTRPFTTAEDIWPLLDSPGEMRALSLVVQHAIRRRWMKETGSKRLRGTYVSKDGCEFRENKIVPIYTSRIAGPEDF